MKALQINVNYETPTEEFKAAMTQAAEPLSHLPGLVWKIWTYDEATRQAGGWYLFEDLESAQAYLESPAVQSQKSSPAMSNFSASILDIGEEATRITRGPIG